MQPASTWGGNYSRFTYDEVKRYFYMLKEQGVPVLDDEFNLSQEIELTLMRRLVGDTLGDGAVGDAFKIVGTGANNDFMITGGDGTADGAAHFYLGGYLVALASNTTYAGQELAPPALTTPGGARVDEVYLDTYLDEVDPVDDPAIVDPVLGVETSRRLKLYYQVLVAEAGAVPAPYTDAQGRYHFTAHLATINRTATAVIDAGMVVDARRDVALVRATDFDGHTADGGAHGATSASQANAIVRRDEAGNFRTNVPLHDNDVTRKVDVDTVQGNLNTHAENGGAHGSTSAATANAIIRRDAAGRAKVAAPSASDDIARKAEVDAAQAAAQFTSGTIMLFGQTAAPTGWTKLTDQNDKALRVVSGTAGVGGSLAFSTAMANRTVSSVAAGGKVGGYTLSISEMPVHRHSMTVYDESNPGPYNSGAVDNSPGPLTQYTDYEGGSAAHSHPFTGTDHDHAMDMRVRYVDVIRAQKD